MTSLGAGKHADIGVVEDLLFRYVYFGMLFSCAKERFYIKVNLVNLEFFNPNKIHVITFHNSDTYIDSVYSLSCPIFFAFEVTVLTNILVDDSNLCLYHIAPIQG